MSEPHPPPHPHPQQPPLQQPPPHPPQPSPQQHPSFPYPGQMRDVDQHTTARTRPAAVTASFVLWVLTSLSWPIGSFVRTLAEDGTFAGFGAIMALFASACIAIAGVWGAVLLLGGNYYALLGLCGGALVLGFLALAAAFVAARDGGTEPVTWVVIVLRLALPAAAGVLSLLPGTRWYFAGNQG